MENDLIVYNKNNLLEELRNWIQNRRSIKNNK